MKPNRLACAAVFLLLLLPCTWAQDPALSSDHPPGNVNELTLAGLRPGQSTIAQAAARFGPHWRHPSADETDLYVWCDARSGLELRLEAPSGSAIEVVTVSRIPGLPASCGARLGSAAARTGRGVKLGDAPRQLLASYGKPFFQGPSSWRGQDAQLIVFNFSWAGEDKPQILESTFLDGRLVKMTLSAQYY